MSKKSKKISKAELEDFYQCYFLDNCAVCEDEEIDFDILEAHKEELYKRWEGLLAFYDDDDWSAAEAAAREICDVYK